MSFARNVETTVNVPEMRAPVGGSTLGDIAQLATAGANIYKMVKDQEAKEQKSKYELQIDTAVLGAIETMESQSEIGELDRNTLLQIEDKYGKGLTVQQRLQYKQKIGEYMKGDLGQVAVQQHFTAEDELRGTLRDFGSSNPAVLAQAQKAVALEGIPLQQMTSAQMEQVEHAYYKLSDSIAKSQQDKAIFEMYPTGNAFIKSLGSDSTVVYNFLASELSSTISQLDMSNPDYAQRVSAMKSGLIASIRNRKVDEATRFGEAKSSMKEGDAKYAEEQIKARAAVYDEIIKNFEGMEDDIFTSSAKLAKHIQDSGSAELQQVMPYISMFSTMNPELARDFMKKFMARAEAGQLVGETFATELMTGLKMMGASADIDLAAVVASSPNADSLESLFNMYNGKGLDALSEEQRDAEAGVRWGMISRHLSDPALVRSLAKDEKGKDNFGLATLQVLEHAEMRGTEVDMSRAAELLSSDGFKIFINEVVSPETGKLLSKYVESYTARSIVRSIGSVDNVMFDASTGKFYPIGEKDVEDGQKQITEFGYVPVAVSNPARKKIDNLNKRMNNASEIITKHNDFFKKDQDEVKLYLASLLPARLVKNGDNLQERFKGKMEDIRVGALSKKQKELEELNLKRDEKLQNLEKAAGRVSDIENTIAKLRGLPLEEQKEFVLQNGLVGILDLIDGKQDESGTTNTDS